MCLSTLLLSFLTNSNTLILNPSRANLQLCIKCKFSEQKILKQNNSHSFQAYYHHVFIPPQNKTFFFTSCTKQDNKSKNPVILHKLSYNWKQGCFTSPESRKPMLKNNFPGNILFPDYFLVY